MLSNFGILGTTSTALLFSLKAVFQRKRPHLPIFKHVSGYSFPSGRALLSFILCSFLTYWVWDSALRPVWKWFFTLILLLSALLQGISRIVLRVHYAADVIAGFCLGYIWAFLFMWLVRKWKQKQFS
jgi:membrane-associated phospholipid phosphatase